MVKVMENSELMSEVDAEYPNFKGYSLYLSVTGFSEGFHIKIRKHPWVIVI